MREIINILILGLLLMSCESKKTNNSTETITNPDTVDFQTTTIDSVKQKDKTSMIITEKCSCSDFDKNNKCSEADLSFSRYTISLRDKNKSDSIFNVYSADNLRLTVKSIRFFDFDTIPEKFAVFKNVEHLVICDSRKNILGLDLFPNLKSLFFWGSQIDINPSDKWLSRIEGIYAEKSAVKGLLTFEKTPNLKDIYFGHARLEPFPADFDKLKCLRRITLGAYRGDIDLSKIDLALNPCIERVEFHTWYNAFSGIPQGLDSGRTFELIINHQKLTEEEKEIIKAFNERNKKGSVHN
jgi:hypothetical protein